MKTIYIDETGLCDRHWTGVEQFSYLFGKALLKHSDMLEVITLSLFDSRVNHQSKHKSFYLGKNRGRFITEYILLPLFIFIHKPEYIIFPVFPPSELCWILKFKRTKIITVIHDIVPWHYKKTMSMKARLIITPRYKMALKFSYAVLTVSETEKKSLMYLNPKVNIFCVYNCICDDILYRESNVLKKLGLEGNDYIFSVSTMEPRKNFSYVLDILYRIIENRPNLKIVFSGRLGWGSSGLIDKMKSFGKNIIFTGFISNEELSTLYQNALFYVSLPYHEGFGRTPIESLLNGTPVVVADIPVFRELLDSGTFFLPLHDKDLATKLLGDNFDAILKLKIDKTSYSKYLENDYNKHIDLNIFD